MTPKHGLRDPSRPPVWLVYCPVTGWEAFDTEVEARLAFDATVDLMRDESSEGWHEAAETAVLVQGDVVAGVRLRVTAGAEDDTEDGERCRAAGWDYLAVLDVVELAESRTRPPVSGEQG